MSKYSKLLQELKGREIPFSEGEPLKRHTTFAIGGPCDFFVAPETEQQLEWTLSFCQTNQIPFFVLGRGSNLLVSDDGFRGLILSTERLKRISLLPGYRIFCASGVPLSRLCKFALEHALSGLEFAYGIPGSVGGAIYMNAGAYGGEVGDLLCRADCICADGQRRSYARDELEFAYRTSRFQTENSVITAGVFQLSPADSDAVREQMEEYYRRRKEKQPLEFPSAGSTFKRPKGNYASALIEQCGLKGASVGGAQVSEKHSGFVINRENASCKDVEALIAKIQKEVFDKTGYVLECEVQQLG